MIEALVFGFFAYFGTEIGEFAHKQYDKIQQCVETRCEEEEQEVVEEDSKTLSTTVIGEDNE